MKKNFMVMVVGGIGMLCGCAGHEDGAVERLDRLFESRYDDSEAPGAAVIIARGDSVIYERYFGIADMGTGEKVSQNTLFNIASISKQFTVVAALQEGIDLDRKASEFFDYPQPLWDSITLRHLASHTSGLPDSRDRSDRNKCVFATDSSSMEYFPFVDSLKFAPGTAYDYLNPSFLLIARAVEQASGQEFCQRQHDKIFGPLSMESTTYFSPDSMPAHTAHGYIPAEGGWKEYDYGEETFFATRPDGGIYSTARDMLKWERGLALGKTLSEEKLKMAYTPAVSVTESEWCDYQRRPNTWYGLGWFVDTTPGMPVKVYHTGDNGGFQAYVAKYPSEDISIIVLENRNDRDRWAMAKAIDDILF